MVYPSLNKDIRLTVCPCLEKGTTIECVLLPRMRSLAIECVLVLQRKLYVGALSVLPCK